MSGKHSCVAQAPKGDAKHWEEIGAEWAATPPQQLWRRHTDWLASELLKAWLPLRIGTVLKTDLFDEAVGDGVAPILQLRSAEVHGIDISWPTVAAAKKRYHHLNGVVADVRALPYPSGFFEAVVSLSTLDHFPEERDIARGMNEIRRVMVPGGHLILSLDNPTNPLVAIRQMLPFAALDRIGLVPYYVGRTLSPTSMARAVDEAGFTVVSQRAIMHCPRVLAVACASFVQQHAGQRMSEGLLSALRKFEGLARLPSRWRTGYFSAVLARTRE